MVEPPKKHHFIPKFYQKGFADDSSNRIWVYEEGRTPRLCSLRKTGMKIALYGFTTPQGNFDSQTIEAALSLLETNTAPVIKKLEKGDEITDSERAHLAKFVSVLFRRTPKHKEKAIKMAEEMMPEFFEEHSEEWLYERIKEKTGSIDETNRIFEVQKEELRNIRERYLQKVPDWLFPINIFRDSIFEQVLLKMDWGYFRSSPTIEFLTCDNPVAFSQGTGLKHKEAVIMCPLTKTLFLQAMWLSTYKGSFVNLRDTDVRRLNKYIVQNAHKRVYASYRSSKIEKFVSKWVGTFEKASPNNQSSKVETIAESN
jgi:hypothetical protein